MARTRKADGGAEAEVADLSEAMAGSGTIAETVEPGRPEATEELPAPEAGPSDPDEPGSGDGARAEMPEPVRTGPEARRRGGFLPTMLGGAVAAGMGFGAAVYVLPRVWTPPVQTGELEAVKGALAEQAARIDSLSATVGSAATQAALAELAAAQGALGDKSAADLARLNETLAELDARLAETTARIDGFEARLTGLEKRPASGGAASATALEAFGREMEALRSEMSAQRDALAEAQTAVAAEAARASERIEAAAAEADRLRTEAEETARKASIRAALGRIEAALTAGGALDPALADLREAGVEIPPALAGHGQGVPTLDALRAAFPPAARDALAASLRETAGGSAWERLFAFLRTQSGARSLTPREGADPDAVLSRAEAALAAGDLAAALAEIGALPAGGQARMAEWAALAKRRIDATAATAALAAEVQ